MTKARFQVSPGYRHREQTQSFNPRDSITPPRHNPIGFTLIAFGVAIGVAAVLSVVI